MLKLILHHPYTRVAEAIDISGANNHGVTHAVGFVADGIAPRSGALDFNMPSSRVAILGRRDFDVVCALKIEVTVRVRSLGGQRTLVDGDNSFTFFIHPAGFFVGGVLAPSETGAPPDWQFADTHINSPDGTVRMVPVGSWVKLTYLHDGFATLRLYINDELAAIRTTFRSPVPPVGPLGVHIGNRSGLDADTFDGEVDDVRISRWDPNAAYYQFFSRTPGKCWQPIFSHVAKGIEEPHGLETLAALMTCVGSLQLDLIRAVRASGEDAIRHNDEFARRYRELWRVGPIDGSDMQALLTDWFGWLQSLIGRPALAQFLQRIVDCVGIDALNEFASGETKLIECDPPFAAYIKSLIDLRLT